MIVGWFVRQMFQKVSRKEIKSQGKFLADRCQRKEGQRLGRSSMPADQSEGAMQVSGEDEQPLCRMALHTENQVKDRRKQERYVAEVTIPIVQMSLPLVQHNTIDTNQTADWQARKESKREAHKSHESHDDLFVGEEKTSDVRISTEEDGERERNNGQADPLPR